MASCVALAATIRTRDRYLVIIDSPLLQGAVRTGRDVLCPALLGHFRASGEHCRRHSASPLRRASSHFVPHPHAPLRLRHAETVQQIAVLSYSGNALQLIILAIDSRSGSGTQHKNVVLNCRSSMAELQMDMKPYMSRPRWDVSHRPLD